MDMSSQIWPHTRFCQYSRSRVTDVHCVDSKVGCQSFLKMLLSVFCLGRGGDRDGGGGGRGYVMLSVVAVVEEALKPYNNNMKQKLPAFVSSQVSDRNA